MATLKEVFAGLQEKLSDPGKLKGTTAVYQFELGGDDGGNYFVDIVDGATTVKEGVSDSPSITISMDAGDFKDMIAGSLNPTMAFMSGKLKVKGDMALAMKLQNLLG